MTTLINHIENHFGTIKGGWSIDFEGEETPFQVVEMSHGPIPDSTAFLTIGLSNTELQSRISNKKIRQELVFIVKTAQSTLGIPSILQQVGRDIVHARQPILRGEVIAREGALVEGSDMKALYAAIPVYNSDDFASCDVENLGVVVFTWLLPISEQEAQFINYCGWIRFEDRLVEENPDLIDLFRDSLKIFS